MKTQSIHEFDLGIDVSKLGCVMLPVDGFNVFEGRGELLGTTDLYTSPDPAKHWIHGDIASSGAHVTLLYGLLRPAHEISDLVASVLYDWERPAFLTAESVEVFPSPYSDGSEPYGCVVARLHVDESLADAHARLSYLPHVDTHPDYLPHVTIAYVRQERAQDWADILNLDTLTFTVGEGLDLGKRS